MARRLVVTGFLLMLLGMVDPLEGSLIIVPGSFFLALGARLGRSPHRRPLAIAFLLVLVGVAALFGLSAAGGVGGDTGRSAWWLLSIVTYPAGWLVGIFYGVRVWRDTGDPHGGNDGTQIRDR